MRTQYGKAAAQVEPARFQTPDWFASHCYIVVIQDIRGQGASDGTFYEYAHDRDDGYDTVEWAARLPGSNGKVGMYGSSYVGATQWLAATAAPPSLKAIVPSNTASDYYDGWTYEDGAFRLAFIEPWMTETIAATAAIHRKDAARAGFAQGRRQEHGEWETFTPYDRVPFFQPNDPEAAPYFFDAIKHPTDDAYWQAFSIENRYNKVQVPVLAFDGWYDAFVNGALRNFDGVRGARRDAIARQNQRIVSRPLGALGWGRPEKPGQPAPEGHRAGGRTARSTSCRWPGSIISSKATTTVSRSGRRAARRLLRHGREHVARGARVAAGGHPVSDLVSGQRRPRQFVDGRRRVDGDAAQQRERDPRPGPCRSMNSAARWWRRKRPRAATVRL